MRPETYRLTEIEAALTTAAGAAFTVAVTFAVCALLAMAVAALALLVESFLVRRWQAEDETRAPRRWSGLGRYALAERTCQDRSAGDVSALGELDLKEFINLGPTTN